ncbi:MAG: 3-oxoacyl-[acyl-carrier-protein] reductase [Planctomycetota bacterium]|jgi:3-oxoacyl-[acyl-carrier protein] reductase
MTTTRNALITGASRGIGRAIATRLAADGRHVILAARSADALESLKDEITSTGGSASVCQLDISDAGAIQSVIDSIVEEHSSIDILVNNAGITRDNLILRMSDEEFDDVIKINLRSVFAACRAAARHMMRARYGRIVNISSTSGVIGNPGQANYCASKAGVIGMTKSIARELGSKGVTANVIAPGFIETDMTASLPEAVTDKIKQAQSIRRLGIPDDIAAATSYMTSDDASFLTGQVLCVDGGLTMC